MSTHITSYLRHCKKLLLLCLALVNIGSMSAQWSQYSNLRKQYITISGAVTKLNDAFIFPGTVTIEGVDTNCYSFLSDNYSIVWKPQCPYPGLVTISYRVMPAFFSSVHRLPQYQKDSNFVFPIYTQPYERNLLVNGQTMTYSGSYGRSMNVGNNQSLNLSSQFNMQMNGYIIDSIKVEGAITDNNIPFQPEGNTQRLQEFDRVYITLEKKKHKLTLGDYNLDHPKSHFLRFQKRVQGIAYEGTGLKYGGVVHHTRNRMSVSKGQFARNIFDGIEGNQGPYKLKANNGEQFFIVLAGTERVYIDGVLLSRGEDRDYIINYNLGELVFMPRIMITKDKRIQVEFEYQDRSYLNSLLYTQNEWKLKDKLSLRMNLYANQDAKNQPFTQELNDDQKRILRNIGDDITQAYYTAAFIDTPGNNKILYRLKDTLVNTITYDSVYEYSTDATASLYQLSFSFVGNNRGNYIISSKNTNGRSYEWIAPIDNVPQGSYEPVTLIITPKKHQLITVGGTYQVDSSLVIDVESSLSNYNPNLFSDIPTQEHLGMAHHIAITDTRVLKKSDTAIKHKWTWTNEANYEMVQAKYRAIAPYRPVEFKRDWNVVQADTSLTDEHLASFQSSIKKFNIGEMKYRFSIFNRSNDYLGYRHLLAPSYHRANDKAGFILNLMNSKSNVYDTRFWRPSFYYERNIPKWQNTKMGTRYELEDNRVYQVNTQTLRPLSYSFNVYNAYIKSGDNPNADYSLSYTMRQDRRLKSGELANQNVGHTIDAAMSISKWEDHQIDLTGSYRVLQIQDSSLSQDQAGTAVLGRLNYSNQINDGLLQTNLLYELGSGQEQKRAFTFIEVPAGQGFYYWIDYNNDGIQQANEFELALYPDQKKYIKIITPTNEYNKVNFNQYNLSIDLNLASLPATIPKRWLWLKKLSNTFSLMGNGRYLIAEGYRSFLPTADARYDSNIVTQSMNLLNNLFFNRDNPKYGITYTYALTRGAQLLTYGVEKNHWSRNTILWRNNINKSWSTTLLLKQGRRTYASGIADQRSYDYLQYGIQPTISYMYQTKARVSLHYDFDRRSNAIAYGGELATAHSGKIDFRLSFLNMGSLHANGAMTYLQYNGDDKAPKAFAILESLRRGQNYIWSLQYDTKLNKNLELSIQYDGRKPGNLDVIHTGRMSIRALL